VQVGFVFEKFPNWFPNNDIGVYGNRCNVSIAERALSCPRIKVDRKIVSRF
jgi:hypothetical protein